MKVFTTGLIVVLLFGGSLQTKAQDDWYKNEPMRCESTATTPIIEGMNVLFPRKLPAAGQANQGKLYLNWSPADYRQVVASNNHSQLRLSHTLTKHEASDFSSWFKGLGNAGVPWYANAATSASAWMIPDPVTKLIFKGSWTLFSALLKCSASQTQALQLAVLFAEGGQLREVVTADEASPGRPYLADSVIYQVRVGAELRNYTLLSCTYAVHLQ